jgi:TPR repeat protein
MMGRRYYMGGGIPQDINAAQKWLQPVADQGNAFAAYYLARILADRDYNKAPAYFKTAAEQGLPLAQYFYGKALKDGRGIGIDRVNAYVWLVVALDAGFSPAQTELSELDGGGSLTQSQIADAKAKARELEQTVMRVVSARGCTGWEGELDEWPTPPPVKLQRFPRGRARTLGEYYYTLTIAKRLGAALDHADRGYVMETGHIVLSDSAEALKTNEQVRKTYLGEG